MMQTTDRRRLTSVAPTAGTWRQVSGLVIMVCISLLMAASDGSAQSPAQRAWQDAVAQASKGFPLPFYPGSKVGNAGPSTRHCLHHGPVPDGGKFVQLSALGDIKPAVDFYKKYFQSSGWRVTTEEYKYSNLRADLEADGPGHEQATVGIVQGNPTEILISLRVSPQSWHCPDR